MRRFLFVALIASAALAQDRAEILQNEVWLTRGDQSKQLTRDGRIKLQVLHSADFSRIVYYEECTEAEHCMPSVVVLDGDGNRLQSFQPSPRALGDAGPCRSILGIAWINQERAIGVQCHYNPSLSEYVEIDLATGKTLRDLAGLGFTPSPNGAHIAYIAPIIHFAPRYRQSNYLLIDGLTIYPLPRGVKPARKEEDERPRDVVGEKGTRFTGIHEFVSDFTWSQDSAKVAFIDCTLDWIETGTDDGGGSIGDGVNNKCWIAVVALNGTARLMPLPPGVQNAHLDWKAGRVVVIAARP